MTERDQRPETRDGISREPKIAEVEKLINHFRKNNREDELLDVLREHGITSEKPAPVVDEGTHEFHEEMVVLNKIAEKEKLIIREHKPLKKITEAFKKKWYFRYAIYYIFIFSMIFIILNAPIIFSRVGFEESGTSRIITVQELEKVTMADSAPLDSGEVIPQTSQLNIPKIGVTAPIIFLASRAEQEIQNNLTQGVVHYSGTAKPGEVGNSFITGHSSNFWWVKGNYNYIFVNLDKMAAGDQAKIYHNGKKYVYSVTEVKIVEPNDVSVIAQTDTPTLTLMTCTPPGTNWKRLIVKMDQVAPKYIKPRVVTKQIIASPNELPSTDTQSTGGLLLEFWTWIKKLFGVD